MINIIKRSVPLSAIFARYQPVDYRLPRVKPTCRPCIITVLRKGSYPSYKFLPPCLEAVCVPMYFYMLPFNFALLLKSLLGTIKA